MAVWHDKLGTNVFLGEVNLVLDTFDTSASGKRKTYQLLAKASRTLVHVYTIVVVDLVNVATYA